MARVLAFSNRKGGSAKTTTTVNIAAALAGKGYKVLVIDADAQAHATISYGYPPKSVKKDLYSFLVEGESLDNVLYGTYLKTLFLIPASMRLTEFERHYSHKEEARKSLRDKLEDYKSEYDFIIFDTPPTFSLLTVAVLIASTELIIPVQTHFLAMESLAAMIKIVRQINKLYNPDLKVKGIIPTFYTKRRNLTRTIIEEIRQNLGNEIILHPVRMNVSLAEAPGYGMTIFQYDPKSNGALDYGRIADQIEAMK